MPSHANFDYIKITLEQALAPTLLEIIDESNLHQGHSGYSSDGSHFAITISAPIFSEKSLIDCHRLIYAALGEKVGKELHAVRITIKR